jgi:hypothetical protein
VSEQRVGHEFAERLGSLLGGAVGEEWAHEGDMDIDEPFRRLFDTDIWAKGGAIGDAFQESCDDRGRQSGDSLRPTSDAGDGGCRTLPLEGLEPRFGPDSAGVTEQTVDDPIGGVAIVVNVGLESGRYLGRARHEHFSDELVLIGDIPVHGGARASGPAGDLLYPHGEGSVFVDDFAGGGHEAFA